MGAGRAEPPNSTRLPALVQGGPVGGLAAGSASVGVTPASKPGLQKGQGSQGSRQASPSRRRPPWPPTAGLGGDMPPSGCKHERSLLCSAARLPETQDCLCSRICCLHPGYDARTSAKTAERGPLKTLSVVIATRK